MLISSLDWHGGNPDGICSVVVSFGHPSEFPPACLNGQLSHEAGLLLVVFPEPMRSSLAKGGDSPEILLKKIVLLKILCVCLKKSEKR